MSAKLSVEEMLSELEKREAFHRDQEAFHAEQEVFHEQQQVHHREQRAVQAAEPGDLIVIAGKGHEEYQEIAGRRLPFSDAAVAATALARRRAQ